MKIAIATLILSVFSVSTQATGAHWQYQGKHGPEHWGELKPEFATCGSGVNQAPIDISGSVESLLPALQLNYSKSKVEVINNGHAIQANISGNNTLSSDGSDYKLLQFHFHSPSENTINGQYFPLEAHYVHASSEGELAVISVMFEEGDSNAALAKIWNKMPKKSKGSNKLKGMFLSSDLMPLSKDYYRFNGSLTTPPCTEGVHWYVMKQPAKISKRQIAKFKKVMGRDTNRPAQAVNARMILK